MFTERNKSITIEERFLKSYYASERMFVFGRRIQEEASVNRLIKKSILQILEKQN
jgi:hypothetical protein